MEIPKNANGGGNNPDVVGANPEKTDAEKAKEFFDIIENAIALETYANKMGTTPDKMTEEETVAAYLKMNNENKGDRGKKPFKNPGKANKVLTSAAITLIGGGIIFGGVTGVSKIMKGQNKDTTPSAAPTSPFDYAHYYSNDGRGALPTEQTVGNQGEANENKEENEKYRFTDEHLYYFEEEKMETHKSTTGVTPESFARAERLVHDAYDSDLTPEEHALIEKGDKKAEGFEKAVQKLYAESIIRECTDSREVMGSWLLLRVKANPDSYPQFKGMTSQQIVDKLYEQDGETNKELLKKYEDDLLNAKYEQTTLEGKWTTFKEVDIRDKNPDRMVQLEEYNITLENRTAVKITFADGSENYGFILAENVGWEIDTNTKTKELTVRDNKARKYKGCAQGAYKIGEPTPTPKPGNPGNPGNPGGGEPGKNAKAIIRNAGDHNTKLKVDGKASSKPAEGGKVNTTDKGGNPEGQKKANDDAEKNRKKAQENEKLSDAEAAKKFNFS